MARRKKMKSSGIGVWGTIGVVLVVMIALGSVGAYLGLFSIAGDKGVTTTSGGQINSCESTTTPDLDINAVEFYDRGALTETTNLYRQVGSTSWTAFTQGTAITGLAVGKDYEVVMGISTSDFTDNAYGEHFFVNELECAESITIEKEMYNDEIETSLTATFFDEDNNAVAETFGAGDDKVVKLRWRAGVEEVFGNPYMDGNANVLCLALNSTEWDVPLSVKVAGEDMNFISTPTRHTATTDFKDYCYEAPVITSDNVEFLVHLDADDVNAPSVDGTATLYAGNMFIYKGQLGMGVEDPEGTVVGTDAGDTLALDFTA